MKPATGSIRGFKVDLTKSAPDECVLSAHGPVVPSMGEHPCMLSTNKGGNVLCCANYSGGNFSMYRIEDGIFQGTTVGEIGPQLSHKVHTGHGRDRNGCIRGREACGEHTGTQTRSVARGPHEPASHGGVSCCND